MEILCSSWSRGIKRHLGLNPDHSQVLLLIHELGSTFWLQKHGSSMIYEQVHVDRPNGPRHYLIKVGAIRNTTVHFSYFGLPS